MTQPARWELDPRTSSAFDNAAAAALALVGNSPGRVLEAGAGTQSHVRFSAASSVIGIDQNRLAIDRNADLDERIVGDVNTYPFALGSFDIVVSTYVLEHVPRPDLAIERFAELLRPGGVMILAVPNLMAPKSILAKWTPHRFHIFVRRRLLGRPNAGKPGYGPYPTVLHRSLHPSRLRNQFATAGLAIVHEDAFEDDKQRQLRRKAGLTGMRWRAIDRSIRAVSLGRMEATRTELIFVLRKTARST